MKRSSGVFFIIHVGKIRIYFKVFMSLLTKNSIINLNYVPNRIGTRLEKNEPKMISTCYSIKIALLMRLRIFSNKKISRLSPLKNF